jgi:hypothetical protein
VEQLREAGPEGAAQKVEEEGEAARDAGEVQTEVVADVAHGRERLPKVRRVVAAARALSESSKSQCTPLLSTTLLPRELELCSKAFTNS